MGRCLSLVVVGPTDCVVEDYFDHKRERTDRHCADPLSFGAEPERARQRLGADSSPISEPILCPLHEVLDYPALYEHLDDGFAARGPALERVLDDLLDALAGISAREVDGHTVACLAEATAVGLCRFALAEGYGVEFDR